MRILAIADEEESWLADRFRPHSLDDVDLIVSCGDLPARYLSNLADLSNKPRGAWTSTGRSGAFTAFT